MDPLTTAQLGWLRGELGPEPDDADLQARYVRLESVRDVGIEVIRERRAALLATPLSVTLTGVAAINSSENVKAFERSLSRLTQLDDDPSDDPDPGPETGPAEERLEIIRLERTRGR